MRPSVALPTSLGLIGANRAFFAVADHGQLITRNSQGNEELLNRVHAPIGLDIGVLEPSIMMRSALAACGTVT